MKTLSLKILGCAAALALLTTTRAQTSDDAQTVPPPDTNVPPPDTSVQQGQAADMQPNVIVVPMPTEALDTNADAGANGAADGMQNMQPMQMQNGQQGQPNQIRGTGGSNNFQQGRGFDRGGRTRGNRDNGQQRLTAGTSDPGSFMPPAAGTNGTDGLILNFRGAQIDQVLNYLSDAAGFIIELDAPVRGTVDVFSARPVSKDEAVQLLDSVLNKNGYAAIRSGRVLRIETKENAMRGQIPVIIGNDPDNIPINDEIVTQIIPIRYVQARQLIIDLSSLTQSPSIIANDAGNSIIVTDTQANIHHLVELVKAIDGSAEDVTIVKPFHLQYHDPVEVASLISSIYADQSNGQGGGQAPIRFGGFGGGGGFPGFGGFGGGRGGGGGGGGGLRALFGGGAGGQQGGQQGGAVRQKAKVVAVADQRTSSVIVTAPKDLMPQIEELVTQIDQDSPKVAKVSVIHLENADPIQVQKVLQQFQGNNSRNAQTTQTSPLMTRENQTTSSSSTTGFGTTGGGGGTGFGGGGGGFGGGGGGGGFGGGGFRGGGQ